MAAGCARSLDNQNRMFTICSSAGETSWRLLSTVYRLRDNLREKGVPSDHAEAHADAVRQFVMNEVVTKQDLTLALDTQTLRLTVRLGAMLAAGIALLGVLIKLT